MRRNGRSERVNSFSMSGQRRRGMSAIEVVMATAVGVPMAAGLFFLARMGSQAFLEMVSVIVGWPHL